jgi:hypothetical protein
MVICNMKANTRTLFAHAHHHHHQPAKQQQQQHHSETKQDTLASSHYIIKVPWSFILSSLLLSSGLALATGRLFRHVVVLQGGGTTPALFPELHGLSSVVPVVRTRNSDMAHTPLFHWKDGATTTYDEPHECRKEAPHSMPRRPDSSMHRRVTQSVMHPDPQVVAHAWVHPVMMARATPAERVAVVTNNALSNHLLDTIHHYKSVEHVTLVAQRSSNDTHKSIHQVHQDPWTWLFSASITRYDVLLWDTAALG